MHHLQRHILSRLTTFGKCRYRDMKPKEVDGNLFTYHLKQLMDEKLVEKNDSNYELTTQGLQYVDRLSLTDFRPRVQPKIVTLLAVRNRRGDWLLYRRGKQPFRGQVGFPYGKIHLNETIREAAKRELREKTGVMADLRHRGDAYITVKKNNELVTMMLCHVFVGRNPVGMTRNDSPIGACFWAQVNNPAAPVFFPGFNEILSLIKTNRRGRFFAEIERQI